MTQSIMSWKHKDGTRATDRALALSAPRKAAFLTELAQHGDAAKALKALKLTRAVVGGWRQRDAQFKADMDAAKGVQS